MAKFISFTSKKQTPNGPTEEIVFVNLDLVSSAVYRQDGSLSLVVHGTRDTTGKVEHYVLYGEEAAAAINVLHAAK